MTDPRKEWNRAAQDLGRAAREAVYTMVGLGVLGFQKAQVARREVRGQLEHGCEGAERAGGEARTQVAKAFEDLDKTVSHLIERLDESLAPVSDRLPPQARVVVRQAQGVRDQVRRHVREYVRHHAA